MICTVLNDDQIAILRALYNLNQPSGCKEIGEAAGMPWRSVMGKLRGLKNEGLVETPEKSKYVISDKGKNAIA